MYIYIYIHMCIYTNLCKKHIYIYIYVYIYTRYQILFGCVCLTIVILAPGASEGGLGAAGQVHFVSIRRIGGIIPRGHFLCASCLLDSHLLWIRNPILSKIDYIAQGRPRRLSWQPKAPQSGTRADQGTQKEAQKLAKENKMCSTDIRRSPTNQKTVFT